MTESSLYGVGQEAEQEFARMLGDHGYIVVTISLFTHNTGAAVAAPMLISSDGLSISPDILAIKMETGKPAWFEVKRKSVPAYFYKWHCWVHGIDKPNIDAYRKAQDLSGYPVYICILEDKSPATPNLFLEWHDNIKNGQADQDLVGPRKWMWITLDDAFLFGDFLPGNPEMVSNRNRSGEGLYWPRSRMRLLTWAESIKDKA